jgi:hypothetical protein
MLRTRIATLRWILGAVLTVAAAGQASATIIFPANQTPFTMPSGVSATANVCRFQHSSSKKKNDFDVTVDWGDATPLDGPFHPAKQGKQNYIVRRAHTYAACGVYNVTCNVDWTPVGNTVAESGSDTNVATVSGTAAAPVMTISVVCPAVGQTGLTASVPAGATNYAWSILDGNGNDLTSLITAGQTTEAITFDAATAGTLMFLSLNETAGDNCPAATSTRRAQVDFSDVGPTHPQHDDVCTLTGNQITTGCAAGAYCPDDPATRAQLSLLGLLAKHWADVPPFDPGTGTGVFADVPGTDPFVDWVEAATGGTEGWMAACDGTPNFCPNDAVTRAQMARFMLLAEHGSLYVPPVATGTVYTDVQVGDFAADFIEQLKTEFDAVPTTLGCTAGEYCPSGAVTRAHLAHFLINVFGVPAL